ncbi:MAG: transporter substrate-binding domain-containing protein [Fibrobacterales bacterium]
MTSKQLYLSYTLVFVLLFSCTTSFCNDTITIATGEYPPFLSQELQFSGVGLKIISEIFESEGVTVIYGFFPWKRSYHYVASGEWDASATWSYKIEREKDVKYSDPLYHSTYVLFHRKENPVNWNTLSDLKQFSLGATKSYTYTSEFYKAIEDSILTVEFAASDEMNLKKLVGKRFDAVPLNIDVGYYLLHSKFTKKQTLTITHSPQRFSSKPTHLIFSKKNPRTPELLKKFNRGLQKLKDSGAIDQYLKESRRGLYMKILE